MLRRYFLYHRRLFGRLCRAAWHTARETFAAASLAKAIAELEKQMKAAAKRLEFEEAAQIRDRIKELRAQQIYKT
jgi:excinuclease ABC subunit B